MGIGVASGDGRAFEAAKKAISSPLLETSIDGAQGVLMNITGGRNLSLYEVQEAADIVAAATGQELNMIFGSVINEDLNTNIRITVIATGFNHEDELSSNTTHRPSTEETGKSQTPQQIHATQRGYATNIKHNHYETPVKYKEPLEYEEFGIFKEQGRFKKSLQYDLQSKKQEDSLEIPAFLRKRSRGK